GGDARASLAEVAGADFRRSLATVDYPAMRDALSGLTTPTCDSAPPTVVSVPEPSARYQRTRLHAVGGIGRVWLARDTALGRDVALKDLRPEGADDSGLWGRFLEEARITGQLEHPGIVPVYELASSPDDRQPFYTMRFIRGRTLTEA